MKKAAFPVFFITLMFLFTSCKTTSIEFSGLDNTNSTSITLGLKIYFPSFLESEGKRKNKMVQGDCSIIIFPDGKCMMIDCLDTAGEKDLINFLNSLGIKKIDYFIATHNHRDHIGCLPALLENFQIENYFWNGIHFNTDIDEKVTQTLMDKKINTKILRQGNSLILDEQSFCRLEVLWPKEFSEKEIEKAFYNPEKNQRLRNNTSIVFKLSYGDFSILFTGDIYKKTDRILSELYGTNLKSTILKAPHHGEFYTANSPDFIKAVSPEYAVILDNQYIKHYNYIITSRYKKTKTPLLYRNTPGVIQINTDGKNYQINQYSF